MPAYTFDDTAPVGINQPYAVFARAQSLANVTLSTPADLLDGISFVGAYYRGNNNSLILLNSQSTAAENGVYMLDHTSGSPVTVSGSFSSGSYTLSGLNSSEMYAVKAKSSTVLTAGDGSTSNSFAVDANGEMWLIVKSSAGGTIVFTGPTTGTASSLIDVYPAKLSLNTTGLTYDTIGNGVYIVNGSTNVGTWYLLTALSAAGVRTYTAQTVAPTSSLIQFTNIAPTAITL